MHAYRCNRNLTRVAEATFVKDILARLRQSGVNSVAIWPAAVRRNARVAELADALDLGSSAERRGGSNPPSRTNHRNQGPSRIRGPFFLPCLTGHLRHFLAVFRRSYGRNLEEIFWAEEGKKSLDKSLVVGRIGDSVDCRL
jgi:hypothetical protein